MISMSLSRLFLLSFFLAFPLHPLRVQVEDKPSAVSQDTAKRLLQANEIAEKFVQRWHETLDFNELQNEFFFQDMATWRAFVREGARNSVPEIFSGCNHREIEMNHFLLNKQAVLSFATFEALQEEYDIYNFGTSTEIKFYPDDLVNQGLKIQQLFDREEKLRDQIKERPELKSESSVCDNFLQEYLTDLVAEADAFSNLLRQHLSKNIFASEQYRKHLNDVSGAKDFATSEDVPNFEDFILSRGKDVDVASDVRDKKNDEEKTVIKTVRVQKGIFTFVFIEENSALKVLFALPTRYVR